MIAGSISSFARMVIVAVVCALGATASAQTPSTQPAILQGKKNFYQITAGTYRHSSSWNGAVAGEFGAAWAVADWLQIKQDFGGSQAEAFRFAQLLGPRGGLSQAFVTTNGSQVDSTGRTTFVTPWYRNPPPNYVTRDQIGGNMVTLGHQFQLSEPIVGVLGRVPATNLPTLPQPPDRIDPAAPPAPEPREKNLVFITHGWNGLDGHDADHSWIQDIADDIRSKAGPNSEWRVLARDWKYEQGGLGLGFGPGPALSTALTIGLQLGSAFDQADYDKVHLIAHSAGSAMIEAIARRVNDEDTLVQTTFLDAYAPGSWAKEYSKGADRADNYFAQDATLWTQASLPNAHNVDVTWLDETRNLFGNSDHSFPWQFYKETTESPELSLDNQGYGFRLSPFYNNWDDTLYPSGNAPVEPGRFGANPAARVSASSRSDSTTSYQGPQIRQDAPVNFDTLIVSEVSHTGTVETAGTSLTLTTGSPVWFASLLNVDEAVNFINFEADFLSEAGAEGLLSVYWEGELIGTVDERFPLDELFDEYSMPLFQDFGPGVYTLAFRLDPFTDVQSSVLIDNVSTGFVPEPAGAASLVIAAALLLRRRRAA